MRGNVFKRYLKGAQAPPEWSWVRTPEEKPEFELRDGIKVFPAMYAEGYGTPNDIGFVGGS